jgi:hypothetical protein
MIPSMENEPMPCTFPPRRLSLVRRFLALPLVGLALLAGPWHVRANAAYPKPLAVPQRWALEFEPGELRLYVDETDGHVFWFFTYKVTNRTEQDQTFAPELTLFTDGGEVLVAGRDVPTRVEQQLLDLMSNELLETQNQIIGDIRQGVGHAREGLAVWPATALDANELTLFIAGLSGDTAAVRLPGTNREVVLRKTLQRSYLVPGNAMARRTMPAEFVGETWIFR